MKLNKQKVFALALAVCLIATLSMGSLAWFTDDDSVTNDFFIAGSEDENPDDVFSVDVWEDATPDDPNGESKIQDGIEYPDILPGDDLYKEVNVENTGAYAQYIRTTVTVTDAHIWQAIYGEVYVPLNKIATDLNPAFSTYRIVYDADNDTLTYVLYYENILAVDEVVTLFTNVAIPEDLTREQAAEMAGGFQINVVAEAVQTENVGNNAVEAFATVGMAVEKGEFTIMTTAAGLKNVLTSGLVNPVVLTEDYKDQTITIDYAVSDVTLDANGMNVNIVVTGLAENLVINNIVDIAEVNAPSLDITNAVAGSSVTIANSTLVSTNGTAGAAIKVSKNCDLTIDGCTLSDDGGKTYGVYGFSGNCITAINSTFEGFEKTWAMQINGTVFGDVKIDGCTFTDCLQGIFKGSVGGGGNNGLLNGDFTFTNNTLTNCVGHDGVEGKMFTAKVTGIITVDGNTRDGAEYVPGAASGIVPAN